MGLEHIKVDMGKLESFIAKYEKDMASIPHPHNADIRRDNKEELSPANILAELKKIREGRIIKTEFQEQIYRNLVMIY